MKSRYRLRSIIAIVLGFVLWLVGFYLYTYKTNNIVTEKIVTEFQENLHRKEKALQSSLNTFSKQIGVNNTNSSVFKQAKSFKLKHEIELFIYKNDSIIAWTTNSIPIPINQPKKVFSKDVIKLKNGWYYFKNIEKEGLIICGGFLIKQEFPYENKDLKNNFSNKISDNLNANISRSETGYNVNNEEGEFIFSIVPKNEYRSNTNIEIIAFACYLFAFFVLLQVIINSSQALLLKRPYLLLVFPIVVLLLRVLSIKFSWFASLSNMELFNPELFASSAMIPSLGDLIINTLIFYFLVNFLRKRTKNWFSKGNKKAKLVLFLVPLFLLSFYVAYQINHVIYALVYDSKISFDLEQLFELSQYSFISVALIGFCFYIYFQLIQYIIVQLRQQSLDWNKLVVIWFLSSALFCVLDLIIFDHSLLTSLWPVILSGALVWFEYKTRSYKFIHVISVLAFISFYSGYILDDYSSNKEMDVREIHAESIAKDDDPIAEYEYDLIEKRMRRDAFLEIHLNGAFNETIFNDSIEYKYFPKLKNKYDLKFHLFSKDHSKRSRPGSVPTNEYTKLEEIILKNGELSSINPNIYFVKNNSDKLSYLIWYPIEVKDSVNGLLAVELRSKKFPKEIGLPSLLLEDETFTNSELKKYSIAKYVDEKLISHIGSYNYPIIPKQWGKHLNQFSIKDNYSHYVYNASDKRLTVLSKEKSSIISSFTTFSYLLIYFGIILLFPLLFSYVTEHEVKLNRLSLNFKFQSVLVGLILLTLITFGIGAGTYVVQQYYLNSISLIKEKTGSVETELQHKFKKGNAIDENPAYLEYLLQKFSRVFVTDINMYDLHGSLLASSQPKIYSRGLISNKMNADAFFALNINDKSEFIHQEKIGELEFLSSYLPFVNSQGELSAYLNIQYISKQDELETQISGFVLAIINIMVLMLAFSIFLAIILSNRLTSPLKYIQESLKSMKLGSKNEPIYYKAEDEIGSLVKEYNLKVKELENYAEQLAKSERESAWREMAKQVAHEIKNPLTPMKLSIQHLNRSIKIEDAESESRLKRVSQSLIEQIDALTRIANEFSNFAQMPKAQEEYINLEEILKSAHSVFVDSIVNCKITITTNLRDSAIVWGDKNLCLRVFNNLIKNATQALTSGKEGKIEIKIFEKDEYYCIEIKDNGIGIDQLDGDKMFIPYFTTKSTGTGLGLAMTKQIVENMNGKIWYKSELKKGTSFFVSFPKKKK